MADLNIPKNPPGPESAGGKETKTDQKRQKPRPRLFPTLWIIFAVLIVILLIKTILVYVSYQRQMRSLFGTTEEAAPYRRHFSYVGDSSSAFQTAVYSAAQAKAEETGDYLEFTGRDLDTSYSTEELLAIAIDSSPDGIIVNTEETDTFMDTISEASNAGIPVICVGTDLYGSERQSYVGISNYTLGQTYAQSLISLAEEDVTQDVLIVGSSTGNATGQALVLSGINDYLLQNGYVGSFDITFETVGDSESFSIAEDITDLFSSGDLPDILICLDETSTTCACQSVVDFNNVGDVKILGYYLNDVIADAIAKDVISGTLTVSTTEIGENAVDNLESYIDTGFTNEYTAIGIESVTADNLSDYWVETEEADS